MDAVQIVLFSFLKSAFCLSTSLKAPCRRFPILAMTMSEQARHCSFGLTKTFKMENNGGEKLTEVFRFSKLLRCDCWLMWRCLAYICYTTFVLLLYFESYFVSKIKVRAVVLSV